MENKGVNYEDLNNYLPGFLIDDLKLEDDASSTISDESTSTESVACINIF
jgi:hypothetical protein